MGKVHSANRNANPELFPDFEGQGSTPFVRTLGKACLFSSASGLQNLPDYNNDVGLKDVHNEDKMSLKRQSWYSPPTGLSAVPHNYLLIE